MSPSVHSFEFRVETRVEVETAVLVGVESVETRLVLLVPGRTRSRPSPGGPFLLTAHPQLLCGSTPAQDRVHWLRLDSMTVLASHNTRLVVLAPGLAPTAPNYTGC